ncbi:MAG TPA: hypothetical protein VG897_13350 [Terriglobales bacterium]|nr:hypothetical protein [Terriglobales bacterium]
MVSSFSSHRRVRFYKALLLAIMALAAMVVGTQSAASAEKPYALLFGTVWGPDQRPVAGVKIYIRREQEKKPRWTLVSDNRGEVAQRVPAGRQEYIIWAQPNKKAAKPVEIKVHVDNDERRDFGLHLTE